MKFIFLNKIALVLSIFLLVSCSNSDDSDVNNGSNLEPNFKGSGMFEYVDYQPLSKQPVKVYFHIPANATANTPIVFLFHGDDRNAKDYREAIKTKSENYNFIVLAPEFSEANYPTGDSYNLGNVFVDGDNPTPTTLNQESIWTFSVIEPLFDYFKNKMLLKSVNYDIIGHSAGGQFARRFIMYKPTARFNKVVASASGWYTVPNLTVDFPYGFRKSPLENLSLASLYSKKVFIQVGSLDNDPNSPGLRHNVFADAQGLNRLSRANYFFDFAKNSAIQNNHNFQWQLSIANGLDHNYSPAINAAADLIFR